MVNPPPPQVEHPPSMPEPQVGSSSKVAGVGAHRMQRGCLGPCLYNVKLIAVKLPVPESVQTLPISFAEKAARQRCTQLKIRWN
jgi:hypothetical protein